MPSEETVRIVEELARHGYNADREAVTLLARADNPTEAVTRAVETVPNSVLVLSAEHVTPILQDDSQPKGGTPTSPAVTGTPDPSVSGATRRQKSQEDGGEPPVETRGFSGSDDGPNDAVAVESKQPHDTLSESEANASDSVETAETAVDTAGKSRRGRSPSPAAVSGDITSTGTGEYRDFVAIFRDRYEKLADVLRGRISHRPASAVAGLTDGNETGLVGMVADVRWTSGGHLRFELEDTTGTYPCLVLSDRPLLDQASTILCDEVVAVEGRVSKRNSGDEGILFVDELYFPDIPHTHSPSTADRQVRAALISDVHVGSQEFVADAWERFAAWLHTDDAADIEYLLLAGDMVEGIGVYPNQDEELDVVDIYDQYELFSEYLKAVPGDMEIVMIPGNHDAVRLAEPQPAFDEELRDIMSAHDATISANPSVVTIEGVSILMYHGVSLDEVIAELPEASYDAPAEAMTHLLRKRHVAPQYGGKTRIAPEKSDHLVIDEVPDIFHAGHVHKFGYTRYRGVLTVNSSCWQAQTGFQKSVNLDPDVAYAPIVDLSTLELQYGHFV